MYGDRVHPRYVFFGVGCENTLSGGEFAQGFLGGATKVEDLIAVGGAVNRLSTTQTCVKVHACGADMHGDLFGQLADTLLEGFELVTVGLETVSKMSLVGASDRFLINIVSFCCLALYRTLEHREGTVSAGFMHTLMSALTGQWSAPIYFECTSAVSSCLLRFLSNNT